MPESDLPPVFDGHNDTLLQLLFGKFDDPVSAFLEGREGGHMDLPRMHAGGLAGGLFAVFVPPSGRKTRRKGPKREGLDYDMPLPEAIEQAAALPDALSMIALLVRIERASAGRFRICRSVADIRAAMDAGAIAAVLHFEGAEAIDPEFRALDVFYAAGLRSLGLVWSRPTLYAHGVPFRFPAGPDTGEGLTEKGRELVRACNARGIAVDLSHINERGFWDVAEISDAPLIASHSNAHVLCPHPRNLTDEQLAAVRDSGGIAGLNFGACFLRSDGKMNADTPVSTMVDHIDHMIGVMGEAHVGLGSDFDGASIPREIGDCAGLPALQRAMRERGHSEETIRLVSGENWLRVLERTWGG
ncbi:dipeptidase [Pararhizobium mangrovi]|uniref:Membrane dipeptidase n=1 Tax=Pararhizobium mangrovi TaxID=2590452 RepID=A0A506UHL9_9HYPH|nr:dipeptidase [Pararhizobium mangrovi]TPW32814.1 membrane dipeptidase [Pararhizobium mangrovi]